MHNELCPLGQPCRSRDSANGEHRRGAWNEADCYDCCEDCACDFIREVLDKAADRAAECIADLVFANSTDDAVVTVFTDYGPDVVAAVRGEVDDD